VSGLRSRIEALMGGGRPHPLDPLAAGLNLAAGVYGGVGRLRAALYRRGVLRARRLPCPVIAVGNLTVGGTGKTPMAIHVAGLLQQQGCRVAVVSRGYWGLAEKAGGVVSDGATLRMTAAEAGDEPYLMALLLPGVPVVVGRNRFRAGSRALAAFGVDILVLDDGYQHLQLARDLNLLLLDQSAPFGNGRVLPRGVLREPASALSRADAVVFTRAAEAFGPGPSGARLPGLGKGVPLFRCRHRPYLQGVVPAGKRWMDAAAPRAVSAGLAGPPTVAFSGIARNDDFIQTLSGLGVAVTAALAFPDHHRYSEADLERIRRAARQTGARQLVTTHKDFVRLPPRSLWPLPLAVVDVRIDFGDQAQAFSDFIRRRTAAFFSRGPRPGRVAGRPPPAGGSPPRGPRGGPPRCSGGG
jgi:tetraacyldisaccharide 4'-kinase